MSKLVVPPELSPYVLDFCVSISKSEPYYIEVAPAPEARLHFCTVNVDKKIEEEGGSALYGYQIWERPGLFIEAEFHTIWQSDKGDRIDVSPKQNKTERILFLHAPALKYQGKQINSIRRPLKKDPILDLFFSIFDAIFALQNHGDRAYQLNITITEDETDILRWLEEWKAKLQILIDRGLTRNHRCLCNSGKKLKHCCLEEVEKGISILKKKYGFN